MKIFTPEGKGRASDREFIKFLNYTRGSLYEVQTQVKLARRLDYLTDGAAHALETKTAEVGRVLNGLIHAVTPVARITEERQSSPYERSS